MKNTIWWFGIASGVAAYVVARYNGRSVQPIEELAHRLQEGWADHHTVA